MADRYEALSAIANKLRSISSDLGLAKGDFDATEYEFVEQAQDLVDDAIASLRRARGNK